METDLKIAVVGGDMRQLVMAEGLAVHGYETATFGFDDSPVALREVTRCTDLDCALRGSHLLVLPLPYSHDRIHINTPLSKKEIHLAELFDHVSLMANRLVAGGLFDSAIAALAQASDVKLCDYYAREELTILNALTTAEGAVSIAMQELHITLDGSAALVLGYGRIGKLLSAKLKALGVDVTVAARKKEDLAWIRANGLKPVEYSELPAILGSCELIFNTVPALILDENKLKRVRKDAVIIDLASKPGGVDQPAAKLLGIKVIWALSLPGKFAPVTSGRVLEDTILHLCREEGLPL